MTMKATSRGRTDVAMKIDINPPWCPSSDSYSNFLVHLTCHNHCFMDFRPVLDYNGEKSSIPQRTSRVFHLFRKDLQTPDTILKAVEEIVHTKLGLYDKLTIDQLLYMAECTEMGKDLLFDQGTSRYAMVAHVHIHNSYVFENIMPLGVLVQVKSNEDHATERCCCAVCLDGFSEQDEQVVYKTCCSHMFHCGCIGKWLTEKGDCPVCRFQLIPDSDQKIYNLEFLA